MTPVGFESKISAGERPKTYALDRAATGTGYYRYVEIKCQLDATEVFIADLIACSACFGLDISVTVHHIYK